MVSSNDELYIDAKGILRSVPLPRIAGHSLRLPDQMSVKGNLDLWENKVNNSDEIIVLDLFSGAGGFSYGFQSAGFFVAASVDRDPSSILTHGYNFLSQAVCDDITNIADPIEFIKELGLPRVDVIIGGPPCQGFSQVGQAAIKKLGLESYYHNIMNNLYKEFVRFVEVLQPKAFVMENVPAMARFRDGELVSRIKEVFALLGYSVDERIINAVEFGVPQKRKRLFIQGNRLGLPLVWPDEKDSIKHPVTLKEAIGDLPVCLPPKREDEMLYESQLQSDYQRMMRAKMENPSIVFDHIIRAVRHDDKVIFDHMEEGDTYLDVPENLRRYRSDSFKDKYSKMIWNEPSWTITAHIRKDSYRYIHPDKSQERMLSIREFARLQSFPDHFRFCGSPTHRMQQIGNAVPPLLAEAIAKKLYAALKF